jgi:antitoxin HigA-1
VHHRARQQLPVTYEETVVSPDFQIKRRASSPSSFPFKCFDPLVPSRVASMVPVHPGKILKDELEARGLSLSRLALALRVPSGRLTYIVNGKRGITPDTALRLARYFGTSAAFWINLQARYDLAVAEKELGPAITVRTELVEVRTTQNRLVEPRMEHSACPERTVRSSTSSDRTVVNRSNRTQRERWELIRDP